MFTGRLFEGEEEDNHICSSQLGCLDVQLMT